MSTFLSFSVLGAFIQLCTKMYTRVQLYMSTSVDLILLSSNRDLNSKTQQNILKSIITSLLMAEGGLIYFNPTKLVLGYPLVALRCN